ncbi:MAG TPA: AAA family ATPase [Syntrophorhabdaceae bacterium]|nr:AAA family ATPase [Syntrophorhabdaceae bacterium]
MTTDYLQFFELEDDPFRLTPDPSYFFPSQEHNEILTSLDYAIEQKEGFSLIIGEPGTGKTTILRILIDHWKDKADIALVLTPRLSPEEFLQAVLEDIHVKLGKKNKNEMLKAFRDILIEHSRTGKRVIIIVDEAQNLPDETLEELRLLSNLETEKEKLLQIILMGQPELKKRLQADHLKQLNQRITIRATLNPLSRSETTDYINFRLIKAGKGTVIFDEPARKKLYKESGGIPRLINLISSRSVMAAFVSGNRTVKKEHVIYAMKHLTDNHSSGPFMRSQYTIPALAIVIVIALVLYWVMGDRAPVMNDLHRTGVSATQPETISLRQLQSNTKTNRKIHQPATESGKSEAKLDTRTVVVTADTANVRNQPSIDADKVAWASKGTVFQMLDSLNEQESGRIWYKIRLSDGRECWISGAVVNKRD